MVAGTSQQWVLPQISVASDKTWNYMLLEECLHSPRNQIHTQRLSLSKGQRRTLLASSSVRADIEAIICHVI